MLRVYIHTKSSEVNNGTPGGVADHYERIVKDPKHARFEADPKYLRGMGFDSVGGLLNPSSARIAVYLGNLTR